MPAPTGLLFVDSFDHYGTPPAQMQLKYTGAPSTPTFITGRSGARQAINLSNASGGLSLTFGYEYPTLCQGIGYMTNAFSNGIFVVGNARSNGFGAQNGLYHLGDGRLQMVFNGNTQPPIAGLVIQQNTWYFVELYLSLTQGPPSTASYVVRINNRTVESATVTVSQGGFTFYTLASVTLGIPGQGLNNFYDDWYITDGEMLGDTAWVPIYPNAVGDSSDWTPTPAVANWNNTKEHAPDFLTSYNEAAAAANQDLYNMDDLGGGFRIMGAHALNAVSKNAAGVATLSSSIKTNATLIQEPVMNPSFGGWTYDRTGYRKNPVTGLDWTAAEINAIQRGVLRVS